MTQTALFTHTPTTPTHTPAHPYEWAAKAGPRTATLTRCPTCKKPILAGLDANQGAIHTHADATPLTPLGEALALLDNRRRTLQATRTGTSITLTRRTHRAITRHPANHPPTDPGQSPYDVLPTHQCHTPPLPTTESRITPATTAALPADAPAPF